MKPSILLLLIALVLPATRAHAWWNGEWSYRTEVVLNTTAAGLETREAVSPLAVPVRLHSGNFDFTAAKVDGSDLRVLAGDDKTPLAFRVERFDGVNELAVVWVQVPSVLPGTDKNLVYLYAGNPAVGAQAGAAPRESTQILLLHFDEADAVPADEVAGVKAALPVGIEPNGLIGPSAKLDAAAVVLPAGDRMRAPPGGPLSLALWMRPDYAAGTLFQQGPLRVAFEGEKLVATLGSVRLTGGDFAPASWSHVAITIGNGVMVLYDDGAEAARVSLPPGLPAIEGEIRLGEEYRGLLDELQLAATMRSADAVRLLHGSQSADAKLIATRGGTEDQAGAEEGGSDSYMGILVQNLTADGWAVIGILGVMFVVSAWVMVDKTLFVRRTESANGAFMPRFRDANDILEVQIDGGRARRSPLQRLYEAGIKELRKRNVGDGQTSLSGASLDAVKAAIDADVVRESNKLNARMVLLTIAISGGPFLGLLGTVVGVMITFAAIAAAGDVNVNAIAPGIAAALLATVAGLAVAIPALFGYNYLASRIKLITSDMHIFVDEFVTRVAEVYGDR